MALVVTIAGINRTSVTVDGSVYVEQRAADFISVCGLRIVDVNAAIDIAAEATILLDDDISGEVFFNGRVIDIRYTLFGECSSRYIDIKCQDLSYQLNETVIDQIEVFDGVEHGGITADDDIIDNLFTEYLPAVDSVAHVDVLQDPLTITFNPCTLRSMLSRICTRTGGYFYIDFDNELHYFDAEAVGVAWWLTCDPVRDGPATNLILNPSFEVDTTGWTASNSTLSSDTAYSVFGDAALRIVTDDVGAGEGAWDDVTAETAAGTEYTLSAYLRGTGTVRLFLWDAGAGFTYSPVITLTNVWTRYEVTGTFGGGAARRVGVRTNVQQSITYYCDGFLLQTGAVLTSYFDGSFGTDFAWTGAAHGSTSTRGAGGTSYLLRNLDMATTATTVLDGVFVVGSEISGWRGTHAPGDRQGIARDNRITTVQGIENRGDAILGKYGAAQVVYTVATYQAGLRAGYDVLFICEIWGVNATLTVRKMIVRWDGCGDPYYTLTLGAVVNPSLITDRSWQDGLTDSITIDAPMLPTSSRGWSQDIVFSATDHNTVAWAGGGEITLADGTVYAINAGNTGNMAAITYIYLDLDVADNALQTTDDAGVAVGSRILLIAVAQNVADAAKDATFQTFGGEGLGVLVTADHIAAGAVTANEIAANTILAGNIAAGAIETDELHALAVTAAKIAANTITADKIEMGIGDGLFNAADGLLLLNPHCEISTTEWWTARKQEATLSGAFHREAGRWLGTRGLVIEEATTNLIKEPSFETTLAFWGDVSATISRVTTYVVFGDYSLKIITDDAGAGEGISYNCTDTTAAATEYTYSVYMRGSGTVRLVMWDAVAGFQYSDVFTLTSVWTRYEMTATFGAGAARLLSVWTNVQQGITFYCDGFQLEEQDYATSYCDGDQGTGYAWTGAAHGSTSTRAVTEVTLDAHVDLISDNNTLSFRIVAQMPYDADATWPVANVATLFDTRAGADNNNRIYLSYNPGADDFRVYINGAVRLDTDAQTFEAGDWMEIIVTLDFTADDYNLYVNGELADNDTTALAAPTGLTLFNLGGAVTGLLQTGYVIDEFAVFDRVLTAIEGAGMYAMTRPMIDLGALDMPGLYILDGRFQIASSMTGNRISITADEIAGYDSGGTVQFSLRSSDGKALAGGGAVVLDENGLHIVGAGAVGPTGIRALRWYYDDAGTPRHMGSVYMDYPAAGPTYTWLTARRIAGDPWTSSTVIIQAFDDVAGEDTRITVQSSDDTIHIGGAAIYMAGDIHVDSGVIEFTPVSGDNVINIANNVADALHITDAGALEIVRIVTTGGAEAIAIDPAGGTVSLGIGMLPTADSLFCVNLPTQTFELMNAGVAGATEQAWVEVEINGVQGWLRVYAGT